MKCPNGHKPDTDTPFFYAPTTFDHLAEVGVLAYPDGSLSNRFADGIAGVPKTIVELIEASDDMPHCIVCFDEAIQ